MKWNVTFALLLALVQFSSFAAAEEDRLDWPASIHALEERKHEPEEIPSRSAIADFHNAALQELRVAYDNWLQYRDDLRNVTINIDRIFDARAELASNESSRVDLLREKLKLANQLELQAIEMKNRLPSEGEMPLASIRRFLKVQVKAAADFRAQTECEVSKATSNGDEEKAGLALAPFFLEINSTAKR